MQKLEHITDRVDRDTCWKLMTSKRNDITEKETKLQLVIY